MLLKSHWCGEIQNPAQVRKWNPVHHAVDGKSSMWLLGMSSQCPIVGGIIFVATRTARNSSATCVRWRTAEENGLSSHAQHCHLPLSIWGWWQLEELQDTLTHHQIQPRTGLWGALADGLRCLHSWKTTQGISFGWTGLQSSISF